MSREFELLERMSDLELQIKRFADAHGPQLSAEARDELAAIRGAATACRFKVRIQVSIKPESDDQGGDR